MSSHSPSEPEAPSLDFDWEHDLFLVARRIFRALKPAPGTRVGAVALVNQRNALTALARVVGAAPFRVIPSRRAGGVRELDILMPEIADWTEDETTNEAIYRVRTVLAAALIVRLADLKPPGDELARATWVLPHIVATLDFLFEEFPAFEAAWSAVVHVARAEVGSTPFDSAVLALLNREPLPKQLPSPTKKSKTPILWGRLLAVTSQASLDPDAEANARKQEEVTTEVEAPNPENVEIVTLDMSKNVELPVHVFEKVETAEEYNGTVRKPDGEDDLDEHLEALEALNMETMFRGGDSAGSIYRADVRLELDIPDVAEVRPGETGILYDEWNHKKAQYKKDWTTVYPTKMPRVGNQWGADMALEHRALVSQLVRNLRMKRHQLQPRKRQLDGEDVDMDAVVNEFAASRAGHGGDPRLYSKRIRSLRSLATTVLLDVSLSSDAWVDNRRVLDVAREALVVLGEATHILGDSLQILTFASETRNHVRVWEIKGWGDDWHMARGRLGLIEPQGYTRIGPALRHASAEVGKTQAHKKLVLLLSDGKPTDYDRYEGRYGVQDVRQAVREAGGRGIHIHGLAIDEQARDYLPQMLGDNQWSLLPKPEMLIRSLSEIYGRLT